MTRTSIYMVGTRNSNGEEYAMVETKTEAESRVEELLTEGFDLREIVCIEGFQRTIKAKTTVTVESVSLR